MKKYLLSICIGLLLSLLIFTSQGLFHNPTPQDVFRILSDGFFLPGALISGLGLLAWISGKGQFTGFRYIFHWIGTNLQWGYPRKKAMNFSDFREQQAKPKQSVQFLLIPGVFFLALTMLFLCLFHAQSGKANETVLKSTNISLEDTIVQHPVFTITLKNGKVIKGELFPETAPESVGNFISLANARFYDGLVFHRVIPGFMVQGGCPSGTGMGGPGYCIKGEFRQNGIDNPLLHTRGVLSMARSARNDSAGSQFFIMVADAPHLDGAYAAFGKVNEGMEALDEVAGAKRNASDKPLEPQIIESIRVETFGMTYPFNRLMK